MQPSQSLTTPPARGRSSRQRPRAKRGLVPTVSTLTLAILLLAPSLVGLGVHADDSTVDITDTHFSLLSAPAIVDGAVLPKPSVSDASDGSGGTLVNVRVSAEQQALPAGLLGRGATAIVASEDGRRLVTGWNDAQGFCAVPFGGDCPAKSQPGVSGVAFSNDYGATWKDGGAPPVAEHVLTRGDPWLARGGLDGTTYFFASLAADDTTGQQLGAVIHRGHFTPDDAFAWDDAQILRPPDPSDLYDKVSVVAAKDGSGAAYLAVTNFAALPCPGGSNVNGPFGHIEVWRTHDGGASWQGPVVVGADLTLRDPAEPDCGNTGILQQNATLALGPDGEVYITWQLGPAFTSSGASTNVAIVVARSLDGGLSFSTPVKIADINSLRQDTPAGYNRNRFNDPPRIAITLDAPHRGRVYVAFASALSPVGPAPVVSCPTASTSPCVGQNLISSQVYVTSSDDRGDTWTRPTAISPPLPAQGVKRFWPVVLAQGSLVDIVYVEAKETTSPTNPTCDVEIGGGRHRVGAANSLVNVWWARSLDGGGTFTAPAKVSSATSHWCTAASNIRPNFGDYIGAEAATDHLYAVWSDGRAGLPEIEFAQLDPLALPTKPG